ncbi:unnamed protein product [Strongylus vulgaris]|uniref:Glucuronosyltransferase n=1 Tax=Strongylus vulgaris TaxID=40348 RepID=A0A3P7J4F0_STRVU|nr:unnamed protein product [Strongylus vulgaris]
MINWTLIFVFILIIHITIAYNYLVYSPLFGYSHAHFMGAIADTLTEAGHNVVGIFTVLMPVLDPDLENRTGVWLTPNVIKIAANNRTAEMFIHKAKYSPGLWNLDPSAYGMIKLSF